MAQVKAWVDLIGSIVGAAFAVLFLPYMAWWWFKKNREWDREAAERKAERVLAEREWTQIRRETAKRNGVALEEAN
jgi:hypothetical protein